MAMNNLPPQAYTRDTLAAAYEWLKNQPISIREMATNADSLVSLFLQSRRRAVMPMGANSSAHVTSHASANAAPGAPAATFSAIPATVAGITPATATMPQHSATTMLAVPPTTTVQQNSVLQSNPTASLDFYSSDSFKKDLQNLAEGMRQFEEPVSTVSAAPRNQAPATALATPATAQTPATVQVPAQRPSQVTPNHAPIATNNQFSVDQKTLEAIQCVQARLNLSSEAEALRALVALGFEKIKNL